MSEKSYHLAVVGATGAVGTRILDQLAQSKLKIKSLKVLASARSVGKELVFGSQKLVVEELREDSFEGIDLALFSAGGTVSEKFAPYAVRSGAVVIDNTSFFRQNPLVPLVVPEVNPEDLDSHQGILACPNCSTIQMMMALEPIRRVFGLKRIIVSTYQAVGGAGQRAIFETETQFRDILNQGMNPTEVDSKILPAASDKNHYPIAFNALPQIDVFTDNDYTYEEMKMTRETKKILKLPDLPVSATCVRIPVLVGHSEAIYIETEKFAPVEKVRALIADFPGAVLEDDPSHQVYPQAIRSVGRRETFVGRIRRDLDVELGLHLWCVSDNLLKGAAWNSVQIAETLVERGLIHPITKLRFRLL